MRGRAPLWIPTVVALAALAFAALGPRCSRAGFERDGLACEVIEPGFAAR